VLVGPELIAPGKKVSHVASYTPFRPASDHGATGQHVHFGGPIPMSIVWLGEGANQYLGSAIQVMLCREHVAKSSGDSACCRL